MGRYSRTSGFQYNFITKVKIILVLTHCYVKERHLNISGEVGNMERTHDGANKMGDMSKWSN